jgi:hypothetical protein
MIPFLLNLISEKKIPPPFFSLHLTSHINLSFSPLLPSFPMAQIRLYDLELIIPEKIWSPNTCKTRYALNIKVLLFVYFIVTIRLINKNLLFT